MRAVLPVTVAAAIAGLGLCAVVPLTWDEAWNFLHVSSHGVRAAFTTYEQPNNHVLFSAVQSLLPQDLIWRAPALLRLPNALFACALASLLARLTRSPLLAALLLLCSPLFTLYLCVGRGYLPGTLLLLAAVASWERPALAGLLGGLSALCVPTFGFALPGAALALRSGKLRAAAAAAAVVALGYAGVFGEMLHQRSRWGLIWPAFLRAFALPAWPAHLCLLLALLFFFKLRPRGAALGLLGAAGSALAIIALLAFFGLVDPPYPRNLLFVPLFLWLSLLLAAPGRRLVVALLCLSAAVEAAFLVAAFRPGGDPNLHPYLRELTPAPLPHAGDFQALTCPAGVLPVCELSAHDLPVHTAASVPGGACWRGAVMPEPGQRILLEPGARLLCY